MVRRLKLLGILSILVAVGYGGWQAYERWRPHSPTERLVGQIWIERVPRDDRDQIHQLLLIEDKARGRLGVTGRSSRWRVRADLLQWRLQGTRLTVRYPQENQRLHFNVRTWRCGREAPSPFELCLELECNGRRARFYSREDWVVRPPRGAGPDSGEPPGAVDAMLDALGRAPTAPPDAELDGAQSGSQSAPDAWPFS
jgi:hypothetical protein